MRTKKLETFVLNVIHEDGRVDKYPQVESKTTYINCYHNKELGNKIQVVHKGATPTIIKQGEWNDLIATLKLIYKIE